MAVSLNPYLGFAGEAREAFEFYLSVFGGDLSVRTFAEGGLEAVYPEYLMHADLRTPEGLRLMGSDMYDKVTPGHGVTVNGDESHGDRIRQIWADLSQGADIAFPLGDAPWGGVFGQLIDRFGIAWLISIDDSAA